MMKKTNNSNSNAGFTLVELMIVLSIIAILAVVLVPKVGAMKNSVKDQGVTVNVNTVRAFLETKIASKPSVATAAQATAEATRLLGLFNASFTVDSVLANPFSMGTTAVAYSAANMTSQANSVIFYGSAVAATPNFSAAAVTADAAYALATNALYKGKVFVLVLADAYVVWGYDSTGTKIPYQVIR